MNELTDYELRLLREMVTGEDQGLTWGAAMSVAVESLTGMGYLRANFINHGCQYEPTEKARAFMRAREQGERDD